MPTIILTPDQIPQMWESIKYSAVSASYVEEEFRERFLNRLLYQLLSSKAQCFVRFDEDRKLQAIALTKVEIDEIRDERSLFVMSLYSFVKVDDNTWKSDIEVLKRYAKKLRCKFITAWATSEKASNLVTMIGMRKRFNSFVMEV